MESTPIPFLTFTYRIKTHLLGSKLKPLSPQQKLIHRIIFKLKSQRYDFKQISDTLNKHNIRTTTGKKFYRSLVWNIYKKRLKRNEFMSQPIVKEYRDFDIIFVNRYWLLMGLSIWIVCCFLRREMKRISIILIFLILVSWGKVFL